MQACQDRGGDRCIQCGQRGQSRKHGLVERRDRVVEEVADSEVSRIGYRIMLQQYLHTAE